MIGKVRLRWIRASIAIVALLFLGIYASSIATAATPEISVQASRTQIGLGETLRLTVLLKNVSKGNFEPRLPPGLTVESQSSQTSVSYSTNAGMERVTRLIFQVRAQEKGRFSIGPFTIKSDGKTFNSNVLMIAVQDSQPSNPKASKNSTGKNTNGEPDAADVFLVSEVARKDVWVNEPFELVLKFYFRVPISGASILEADLSKFQSFDDKDVPQQELEEIVQGVKYQVLEVRKQYAAKTSGSLVIPSLRIETQVSASRRRSDNDEQENDPFAAFSSAFDDPFFARKERKVVTAAPIPLVVKPLPDPKPEGYTGIVGNVSFAAELSKKDLAIGENATITITVEGTADLSATSLPEMPAIDGVKFYPDKPVLDQGRNSQGKFFQRKTFKIGVVPTRAGDFEIPARHFFTFRPDLGSYEEKTVGAFSLRAQGSSDTNGGVSPAAPIAHSVQETGSDILPPKADLTSLGTDMRISAMHIVLWWSAAIAFFSTFVLLGIRNLVGNRSATLTPEALSRRARANFARELAELQKQYPQGGDIPEAHLVRALRTFVSEKFSAPANAMTAEELREFLCSQNVDSTLVGDLVSLVSILDNSRYAGKENRPTWPELLSAAERGVTRIGKEARV